MQDFRNLFAWQRGANLLEGIYRVTAKLPNEERYVFATQMRRAALSITNNIAEGCGRKGDVEFARFLQLAMGSASELENCVELGIRVGLINSSDGSLCLGQVVDVKRLLAALLRKLNAGRRG